MHLKYFLCTFLAVLISPSRGLDTEDVSDVFELTTKVMHYVTSSWEIANQVQEHIENDKSVPHLWFTKNKERLLLRKFGELTQLVHNTRKETSDLSSIMLSSLKKLESMSNAVLNGIQINELLESVRSIENDFKTMEEYKYGGNEKSVNETYASYTLEKFADAMLSYSSGGPHKQMAKIHSFIVPEWEGFDFHTHGGIFNILKDTMQGSDMICDQKQSLQQMIFNMYSTLHFTQLKGFSVMQFSWMLIQTYGKGNFSFERIKQTEQFQKRINEQLQSLRNTMFSASNLYWRCDPKNHVKDKTYLEVTQLLQGYIENEADMNYEQSCTNDCGFYEVSEHKTCFRDQFCAKQPICNGRILGCRFFDSDMTVCQSPFGSNRRYDYISYKNGKQLGDSSASCKGTLSKVDSWWVYLLWHCSYCFCICDSSDPTSDRYFSLQPSLSNINENKVVTGLRFIKMKHMFHLQVQEGELSPRGLISEFSRQWVDLPGPEFGFKNKTFKNGVDYHMLSYTDRAIDIDNVIAPENMVITGLKFRKIGSHLNIEIRVTPFDFITGKLIDAATKSYWVGNDNTELSHITKRVEIDISNSDLPTKSHIPSEPDMSSNKYILFTHSSIDHDVAQTTLPFIDKQPVTPYPGVPLSGVGIYFKGTEKFGGYIAPSVFTYDFSNDINNKLFPIN